MPVETSHFPEGGEDYFFDGKGKSGLDEVGFGRLVIEVLHDGVGGGVDVKGEPAGGELVEDDAEGVDVTTAV